MSLLPLLNLGASSLNAASAGLGIAGENITNANTPGYVRRNALLEASVVKRGIAGGVFFEGVGRAYDGFSYRNLVNETGLLGAAKGRSNALSFVEPIVAPPDGAGIGDRMSQFFASLDTLAAKADDPSARLGVVQSAREIASAFNDAANGLTASRQELLLRAQSVATEVNGKLDAIAALNNKIVGLANQDTSAKAEMLDHRDQLVREVAEQIDLRAVPNADGSVTLLSSGSALVDGSVAADVTVGVDANNDLSVSFTRSGKTTDVSARLSGGVLGGIREVRDRDIPEMMADIDQLASDFAAAMNAAHTGGLDLNGAAGLPLFTDPSGNPLPPPPGTAFAFNVNPAIAADPNLLAAADAAAPPPGGNTNALAMSQVRNTALGAGGTPAERVAAITGKVGTKVAAARSEEAVRDATVNHAASLRESISGVSLDEEMISLTKFQRAFEASMKVIETANEMLDELVRRF